MRPVGILLLLTSRNPLPVSSLTVSTTISDMIALGTVEKLCLSGTNETFFEREGMRCTDAGDALEEDTLRKGTIWNMQKRVLESLFQHGKLLINTETVLVERRILAQRHVLFVLATVHKGYRFDRLAKSQLLQFSLAHQLGHDLVDIRHCCTGTGTGTVLTVVMTLMNKRHRRIFNGWRKEKDLLFAVGYVARLLPERLFEIFFLFLSETGGVNPAVFCPRRITRDARKDRSGAGQTSHFTRHSHRMIRSSRKSYPRLKSLCS